jgi:hypothetical protein
MHRSNKVGTFGVRIKEKRIECNHSLERKGKERKRKRKYPCSINFLNHKATMSNQPTMLGTQPTASPRVIGIKLSMPLAYLQVGT